MDLTEQETELYDRQIRLWGLESQKRIRTARVLICGMNGLGAEVAKNIILSGVNSVTLMDHQVITETDFCSQFFASYDSIGKNRAEASLLRAQALNPMTNITIDKGKCIEKPDEYFHRFDVVVLIELPTKELIRVNNICRFHGIKFFSGDVWGLHGYIFSDLQVHEFAEEIVKYKTVSSSDDNQKKETVKINVKRTMEFPPLQDVVAFDYTAPFFSRGFKRKGPSYIIMRIMQQFRDEENRDPMPKTRDEDIQKLYKIRDKMGKEWVPDSAFELVFCQLSPAAAIVGGALAQEIIKSVSQKETPHLNVFLFDPNTCCGFVEAIAAA